MMLTLEPVLRLGAFVAVLLAVAAWEWHAPRRRRLLPIVRRWPGNLGLAVLNTVLLRAAFPLAGVAVALFAQRHGLGLLNLLRVPAVVAVPVAVVALDLAIYAQHRAFHAIPALWRLHRVHHADIDFDVTTGLRFHPLEMLLSLLYKATVIAVLGAPAVAVLVFEVLLNAGSMFSHANAGLPARTERALRAVLVTPDMHRVHHSVVRDEMDSNFGFNLSWWDRLFGTYRQAPAAGQQGMIIGLGQFRAAREMRLDRMLWQPLRSEAGSQPIARRSAAL